MGFIARLLGGLATPFGSKLMIFVVLALVVGGGAYIATQKIALSEQRRAIKQLNKDNNDLTVNNGVLKANQVALQANLGVLSKANDTNFSTAKACLKDHERSQAVIQNLAQATLRDKQALDGLTAKLETMLKDPKNDGPVAPVLREIIREIQRNRKVQS